MTRYYEAEFGLWVEEPDPLMEPACGRPWTGGWDHANGPRPRCFRPRGHEGEHRETRKLSAGAGLVEYYWTEEAGGERVEVHRVSSEGGAGPAGL